MILRRTALGKPGRISEICWNRLNPVPDQILLTLNTCEVTASNPVARSGFAVFSLPPGIFFGLP